MCILYFILFLIIVIRLIEYLCIASQVPRISIQNFEWLRTNKEKRKKLLKSLHQKTLASVMDYPQEIRKYESRVCKSRAQK